jgi:hypothetical protein
MENAEAELILAIVKQAIRDYIRLDPDSDKVSAEYHIDEGHDYRTAEDFLFYDAPIPFGKIQLTFSDICYTLNINQKKIKAKISKSIVEY